MSTPDSPKQHLKDWGFPARVYNDPLHLSKLPEIDSVDWKPFMLIYGGYCTGKTSMAANKIYHDYVEQEANGTYMHDMGGRFDTLDLVEILCLADKIGLARACDQALGSESAGERMQNDIEIVLASTWGELLILDDFNLDAMSNDLQLKKINKIILNRFMQGKKVWLISNETPETLVEVFPRLMSRIEHDEQWSMVEKTAFDTTL